MMLRDDAVCSLIFLLDAIDAFDCRCFRFAIFFAFRRYFSLVAADDASDAAIFAAAFHFVTFFA